MEEEGQMTKVQQYHLKKIAQKSLEWISSQEQTDISCFITGILNDALFRLGVRDACERCKGEQGGIPGNENVNKHGIVLCDYCSSAEFDKD